MRTRVGVARLCSCWRQGREPLDDRPRIVGDDAVESEAGKTTDIAHSLQPREHQQMMAVRMPEQTFVHNTPGHADSGCAHPLCFLKVPLAICGSPSRRAQKGDAKTGQSSRRGVNISRIFKPEPGSVWLAVAPDRLEHGTERGAIFEVEGRLDAIRELPKHGFHTQHPVRVG